MIMLRRNESQLGNELDFNELLPALNGKADGIEAVDEGQLVGQELARGNDAAVDEEHEIVGLDAGFGGGRAGLDAFNERGRAGKKIGDEMDAERGERVMLLRLFLSFLAG